MTLMRMPLSVWGIFMATILGLLAFPALFVSAIMMLLDQTLRHQLLHAGADLDGRAAGVHGRQSRCCSSTCSGSSAIPRSTSWRLPAFGIVSDLISDARAQEHLRLPHDGLGDPRDRRPELRRLGAPHVRQRHEPVLRLLLRDHHADHRGADGHQGLQLGADAVARQHPSQRADAVRDRLHLHLRQRRADGPVPGQRGGRPAAVGHHVRRRPFPHGDGRSRRSWSCSGPSTTGTRRSPAACSTTRWARSISGSPSSAPTRSTSRCTTWASWACRAATTPSAARTSSPSRRIR